MIDLFKVIKGIYDSTCFIHFDFADLSKDTIMIRGHTYKLVQNQCYNDLSEYNFTSWVTPIWNSSHEYVISIKTANTYKNRIDKFWLGQEVLYDYDTDLHGIGNRSINTVYTIIDILKVISRI